MPSDSHQRKFYLAASLSIACSLTMLGLAYWLGYPAFAPFVFVNWLLFVTAGYFAYPKGGFRLGQRMTRKNNLIFAVVMLTFTACGLLAFSLVPADF